MTSSSGSNFKKNYQTHRKRLNLKGLQPKTIETYARAIRRIGKSLGLIPAQQVWIPCDLPKMPI